ncbi:MAG: cupin domain-containing protein [Candidatus Thorarchaeota archaeon]|jgi:mannose-6-phosphate isomerase-like protein (cupin superfamily)
MVKVYRASETTLKGRAGYGVKYVADIGFGNPIESAGFILVKIPPQMKTTPHAHGKLDEAFVIMNPTKMGVDETLYDLDEGDVVLVEPGEWHWFETPEGEDVSIIAVKLPNLKDDKIETD